MEIIFLKRTDDTYCMVTPKYAIMLNTFFNTIQRAESIINDLKISDFTDMFPFKITAEEYHEAYQKILNENTLELHKVGAMFRNQFIENVSKTDVEGE